MRRFLLASLIAALPAPPALAAAAAPNVGTAKIDCREFHLPVIRKALLSTWILI